MKTHARVVVVGGGIVGVGLLWHLTLEGWTDVVLVEKGELSSGSTWHAAGQVPSFSSSLSLGKVHDYGVNLYPKLEEMTGQSAGWHGCGGIRLATTKEDADWFQLIQGNAKLIGYEMELLGPEQIKEIHPYLDTFGVYAGAYTPNDGHVDPASTTQAMAIGARKNGAEIYRRTLVTDIKQLESGEWEVTTDKGTITCEHVVNAAGSYADQVGAWSGLEVPISNNVHQYVVTEAMDEIKALDKELPVIRDPYSSAYIRQEQNAILVGPYEQSGARTHWDGTVPWEFESELLEPELERIFPWLEKSMERMPLFAEAGLKRTVCGLITHTPDGNFMTGPAPGLKNYWLACGFSIGICQGAGAGKYLAQWMVHGQSEINMHIFDPRRFGRYADQDYCIKKSVDDYQHMYHLHCPGEFRDVARKNRVTPLYDKLKAKGAEYAEVHGWERPKYFDLKGEGEELGFRHTNTFPVIAEECKAVREAVGIFDLSSFAKYKVTGPDAHAFLNRISANKIPNKIGRVTLSHFLNDNGFIMGETTITRLKENLFYLLSGAGVEEIDYDTLTQSKRDDEDVTITNATDTYGMMLVTGPNARKTLQPLTDEDLSNDGFKWMSGRFIDLAGVTLVALRVSYAGELGWELHLPMEDMEKVYDAIWASGEAQGIRDFGAYALNSLRMEKAYKGMHAEMTNEVTMIEADMERFVKYDKEDFVGKAATQKSKQAGARIQAAYVEVENSDNDILGNEPVFDGDRMIGLTTSGGFGHTVQKSLGFVFVEPKYAEPGSQFQIMLMGDLRTATVLAEPAWDPKSERLRA